MRLFCLPYAGGGASIFRSWQRRMSSSVDVCAIQPPGRENRIAEPPVPCARTLVAMICDAIFPLMNIPYIFFGHSMGSLLAFEVCRELRRRRLPQPERLFVSASRPPHIPEPRPLHHLPDDLFIEELRRFSGTPEAVLRNEELMRIFIPILRTDFSLEETYVFQDEAPLAVPFTAYYGTEDPEAPRELVSQWSCHTSRDFSLEEIAGGHFFIQSEEERLTRHVRAIVESSAVAHA